MQTRGFRLGVFALSFGASLAMALFAARPASSCDPFYGYYPGTRVMVFGGMGYCAGDGNGCIESGCIGQGYCVQDGLVQRCYRDMP